MFDQLPTFFLLAIPWTGINIMISTREKKYCKSKKIVERWNIQINKLSFLSFFLCWWFLRFYYLYCMLFIKSKYTRYYCSTDRMKIWIETVPAKTARECSWKVPDCLVVLLFAIVKKLLNNLRQNLKNSKLFRPKTSSFWFRNSKKIILLTKMR